MPHDANQHSWDGLVFKIMNLPEQMWPIAFMELGRSSQAQAVKNGFAGDEAGLMAIKMCNEFWMEWQRHHGNLHQETGTASTMN
jgi:hypothetical protein